MRPKTFRTRALVTLFTAAIAITFGAHAQSSGSANIAATDVYISGSSLALEDVTATTGVNIPVQIQTSFGGLKNEQAPKVPELSAVGDLTGPGLSSPITLTTDPGHAFTIPGLPAEGTYLLQNVRLMRGSTFVQAAVPSSAAITVADILKTKVSVRQLTAAELRARGITIDERNFDVYEYTLSFFVGTQEVLVPFPVMVDKRTHEIIPINKEQKYSLPGFKNVQSPPRWGPPTVSPMELGEDEQLPGPPPEDNGGAATPPPPRIPAAIVIPNTLGVLHQFFAVALTVTNNAPTGSSITLDSITATLKNPPELRVADVKPAVSFGRPVPLVDPNTGTTILIAQAKAEADWTLEALKTGTHTFSIEVNATYRASSTSPAIPLRGSVSQQLVVHDPRFNITFSHPDTVRAGLTYSTFTFITNTTPSIQTIRLRTGDELPACSSTGDASICRLDNDIESVPLCSGNASVDLCRPADDLKSQELTLKPGATRTVVYKLRSNLTGNIFATAGSVDSDVIHAAVQLHMGVSTSGIPLSPATLVMPYYAQYLDQQFVTDQLQLLGLGYSLATAPVNQTTASFPRVITTDVFHRAVDIARAGQRIFIGEDKRDSFANLTLDLLGNGNGNKLSEWDELRRREYSGRIAGASLARQLEAASLKTAGDFDSFLARFGQATAWRAPYFVAVTHGAAVAGNARPYAISLRGVTTNSKMDLPNELATEESHGTRDVAFGDLSKLTSGDNLQTGEIATAGLWSENYEITVTPAAGSSFVLDVLYPSTAPARIRHALVNISNASGKALKGVLDPTSGIVTLTEDGGSASYSGNATEISPAPLAIIAAHQDMHLDENGHKVAVLFNRPVDDATDYKPVFSGKVVFNQGAISYTGPRGVDAAALQDDARTIYLTFDHALSKNATYSMQVQPIRDPLSGTTTTFADVVPVLENDRPAGIIYGRVLRGDNTPVPGAQVVLTSGGTIQYDTSSAAKADFLFEYVLRDLVAKVSGTYTLRAVDADGKAVSVDGAIRLTGVVETVNLVYLGRGSAEGRVTYDNGDVVPNARVVIGSTLFDQFRTTTTGADGTYKVTDLPVGPLTFSAVDTLGNTTFAASEIRSAGEVVHQDLSIYRTPFPGTATVRGIVVRSDTGAPVPNAHVGVYTQGYGLTDAYTDANGHFEFEKVTTGLVTVLASEWSVSRKAIGIDFDLAPDQVKDLTLTLEVNPGQPLANLEGDVEEEDPLNPGTYKKVPGALVQIKGAQVVTCDANGHFTYSALPLTFGGADIKAYNPASKRVGLTSVPTLDPAINAYVRIPIRVSDAFGTGNIQVRVLNAAGQPVSNMRVFEPGYPITPLRPIGNGKYQLDNVRVGSSVSVWAVTTGDPTDPNTSRYTYGDQYTSGNASVAFNGQTTLSVLRMPGQGKLRVRLLTDIISIGDVNLQYGVWDDAEQAVKTTTRTASTKDPATGQASYAVFEKVPVGGSNVYAALAGFGYDSKGVNLVYDGQILDIDLQAKKLASVAGVVYNIDGITPMPGVPVRMTDGAQNQGPLPSALDGSFKFGNVAPSRGFTVTAESNVGGIYRVGIAGGVTPSNGGPVNNISVTMKQQGSVEGFVVYSGYKVFDPNDSSKNVVDDTPNDLSDNARVPLAQFVLREVGFPYRSFGKDNAPLSADITGHFQINNIFAGPVRLDAWSQQNQDLRGSGNATVVQEGSTVSIYAAIGTKGFGPLAVTVVDPNNHNQPVENAEVTLVIPQFGPPIIYDFGTTDANGTVRFDQVPAGNGYEIDAFSKLVGKSGKVGSINVLPFSGASVLVELQFSGSVNGTLTDPEANNAGVPGIPVILATNGYQQQTSTTVTGTYFLGGIHEGSFVLDALQETTRRRAHAQGAVSAADPNPTVNMELEHTSPLYVKVFYPKDDGSASNVEVPTSDIHVKQRCRIWYGNEICEYTRDLQGSGLVFTSLFASDGYSVSAHEVGGDQRSVGGGGSFPVGATATNPFKLTLPAYGTVEITVRQPDAGGVMRAATGARVRVSTVTVTTDTNGVAVAHGIPLGDLSVGAVSFDGLFSAYSPTVHLGSQTVPLQVSLDLGAYAGVSGYVNAELGGPSFNTRVVANFAGRQAMTFTDATGFYKFQGIAVANGQTTPVSLVYYGPDDRTVGASQSTTLGVADASQIRPLVTVTLDATPPEVVSISPQDNSINVSPDSNLVVVFTEPIAQNSISHSTFQLFPTDGSAAVNTTLVRSIDPVTHTCTVTAVVPPSADPAQRFPLKSNMLYRVLLTGGLTDEQGHPLAQRGFSFITADYIAPKVVSLEPQTNVPLSASTTFNVRFNKPLASQLFNASHNIVAPLEMHLYKLSGANGTVVSDLPGSAYGDQTNTTLSFAPSAQLEEKTYYRLAILGVRDTLGNVADPITYDYVSFDKTPPYITFDAPVPAGTAVISGVRYTLKAVIRDGSATADPATDTGRVDFFRVDGANKTLLTSLTKSPFEYSFVAPTVTQTGTTLTFHVEASDTSFNNATPQEITFDVAPNLPPQGVTLTLTTPDPIYPNTKVSAKPSLTDEGVLVTLQAQLTGTKTDGTAYTSTGVTGQATRAKTTDPWTFTPASFDFVLPSNLQDGSTASITMTAADGVNALVNATPATFTVAADTNSPTVTSLTVSPASPYHLNDKYTITAIVKDAETGVSDVTFTYDGKTTTVTSGTLLADGSYRFVTPQITVPAKNDDTKIAIVATAKDFRGNKGTAGAEVTYIGLHDATVPRGAWVSPIANAAWPSDQTTFTTTLRVYAKDDQAITSVTFTIPGVANPVTATAAGNDLYTAQATFPTPAAGSDFTVTAAINDADPSHTQTVAIPITLVKVDTVLGPNFTQAITSPTDALLNKSVLLQGPNVHLVMHVPFTFRNLIAVDGASIETLPTTTTTERKLDLTVSDTFYVDSASIIDVAGKGYVGGWGANQDSSGTKNEDGRGRTAGNTVAGGANPGSAASHGGAGGENGGITNATYGSIINPRTLGAGGSGGSTCCNAGGQGGGAVSVSGGSAGSDLGSIIVAGTIRADGITGFNSAGAGGSVRLAGKVLRLGRNARVTAIGSDENSVSTSSRGSGGGRIAITASEQLDTDDTQPQIQTHGGRNGRNGNNPEGNIYVDAGAGTTYIRRPGQQFGELVISAYDERYPATTHQTRPTILGYAGSGNSTSLTASTLTDSSRTFVTDAIGEELLLGGDTTKSYTITAVSADGHTLTTDAADGSLLNAPNVNSGVVAYAGLLQFDVVRVADRALARVDDSFATGGAVDDVTKATVTAPALALRRTDFPAITSFTTTPAAGSNLARSSSFTASYTATSLAGIGSGSLAFSPVAAPNVDAFSGYPASATKSNKSIGVPSDAALGSATLALTVTDRSGRSASSAATSFTIIDNAAPTIDKFDVTPSSLALYAGHSISVDSAASDDLAVTSLTLATSLGTLTSGNPAVNGTSTSRTFSVAVPAATKGGTTVNLTLSASDGFPGRAATTQSKVVTITTDPNPPAVNVTSPIAGTTYQVSSNVTIPVRAVITDAEVAVDPSTVYVSLGGANPVAMAVDSSTPNGFKVDLPVPAVDGTQAVQKTVVVTAKDYEGNPASSTSFNVNIQPVFDPNGPVVSWLCPTSGSGALFSSGYTVIARVSANPASSDNGITAVNFYIGDSTTPIAGALTSGAYQASLPLPAVTADTQLILKVVATSIRGNITAVTNTVTVIAGGTSFTTASNITASDNRFENQTIIVRGATLTIDGAHSFARLLVLDGGVVTHTVIAGGSTGLKLTVTGQTYVSCGGALDASGKGYANNASYPGATVPYQWIAGSHIGASPVARVTGAGLSSTFGNVYRPQEAGGGAYQGNAGGGVIRLDSPIIGVDGAIRANGSDSADRTGAGGSVWITTTTLKASGGSIEARGGDAVYEPGGGGAIAIEYTDGTSVLGTPVIRGGSTTQSDIVRGGSGSLYVKGPSSTYGDLTVDIGAGKATDLTVLPSLGSGTAQSGSSGATLVTGRSTTIPPYFAGQWVEVSNGATLKGTWRVGTINDRTVTLVPNGSETIAIQPNDAWQGVQRFDNVRTTYGARVVSTDPIRLNGAATVQAPVIAGQYLEFHNPISAAATATITGNLKVPAVSAADITVKSGASVYGTSTNAANPLTPFAVSLTAANSITVESGALIDLNGAGYQSTVSYPGAITPYAWIGGSHMGVAVVNGVINSAGATSNFGSVYRPQEAGGGAYQGSAGGGVVRINAPQVTLAGTVRANGVDASGTRSGAGGSIWITSNLLRGTAGSLQARAGDCTYECGGGGAIAIEYADAASVLPSTLARGGNSGNYAEGGAGTVYLKGPSSTYGALVVDNAGLVGEITSPPSLGRGTTLSGTSGTTVVTDRSTNIPPYFAGHWVEIYAPDGTLRGTWRIASINNKTVTLQPNSNETINATAGDTWQGVYRFDSISAPGGSNITTIDPIRIGDGSGPVVLNGPLSLSGGVSGSDVTINGSVTLGGAINATNSVTINGAATTTGVSTATLRVSTGATLTNAASPAATPFTINVSGAVTIDGTIDVSGHGYTWNTTYPGATLPGNGTGGSHIGVGGLWDPSTSSTFGSVYRPQEAGGGGDSNAGLTGGGIIRLNAGSIALSGSIKADGPNADGSSRGGAGGSIWITTGSMSGTGTVSVNGSHANYGSGGGGAIAIEYANGTSVPWTLTAKGGTTNQGANTTRVGGAGTVYTRGPGSTYGDVTVDNTASNGNGQGTSLPSLGRGLTLAGTTGGTVVTDRSVNIPSYFIGHWVEIYAADGTLKGTWKIATINTKTITLAPNTNETINVAVGDTWQGVYRFDTLNSPNGALILGGDPVRIGVNGAVVINGPSGSNPMNLPYAISGTNVTIGGNVLLGGAITATNSLTINTGTTTATAVTAPALHIASGGALTSPASVAGTPFNINVSGTLTIDANGSIDVTGRGYTWNISYPGATLPGNGTGGSHIGVGGLWDPSTSSTFGSVYRPQEAGGGGDSNAGLTGGGIIRLNAGSIALNGSIKAEGPNADGSSRGGAGGSIWITTGSMSGTGTVSANGSHANYGSGGGGAIAIEYSNGTSVPWTLTAKAGTTNQGAGTTRVGGAGTIYTRGPGSTYGDVTVDNGASNGNGQGTSLPSLGSGIAQSATPQTQVLLSENFDDSVADGWTPGDGTWSVGNFANATCYAQSSTANQGLESIAGSTSWTDYTVEADLYAPGGVASSHPGIIFRAQNSSNYEVFYFRPHSSGTSQAIQYLAVVNGTLTTPGSVTTVATIPWSTWFHVKVVVAGNQASVYVTDMTTPKLTVTLVGGWSAGAVGLFEHNAAGYYDNFVVTRSVAPANAAGSATVITNRLTPIPSYFAGHWVEVTAPDGTRKGTWQIASVNDKTFTLAPNGSADTVSVVPGDTWQGVYRFDTLNSPTGALILGGDPVRIGVNGAVVINGPSGTNPLNLPYAISGTDVTIGGNVLLGGAIAATNSLTINAGTTTATAVTAPALHIASGGALTNPASAAGTPFNVNVSGALTVDANGSLDVTGHGYTWNTTYPGATLPGNGTGGSHIGVGGLWDPSTSSTFGSVYRPQEAGGGGDSNAGLTGGGVIRLNAGSIALNGSIKADGPNADGSSRGGAGGSIWITTGSMSGTGTVSVNGSHANYGSGGGGAIAIEYSTGTSVSWTLTAKAGTTNQGANTTRVGGAGTIYTRGPSSTNGDVIVDNGNSSAGQLTEFQALGIGIAQTGSTGNTLVTDRTTNIPAYFAGHWVIVTASNGAAKGAWRIATINAKSVTLAPNGGETISIQPGDRWRGSYKFDSMTLKNCTFRTADLVELAAPVNATNSPYIFGNVSAPIIDVSKITIQPSITGVSVIGSANAVTDTDKPISVTLTDTNTGATFTGTVVTDGSFVMGVQGNSGDTITIKAKDSHLYPLESLPVTIGTLPNATPAPTQINKTDWTSDSQFVPRLLAVEGNWLAVSSRPASNGTSDKVVILDISDPLRPVYKRTISTGSVIYGISIQNGYLFTANTRFSSINLNDPNSTLAFAADANGDEYSLTVAGTYAYTGEVNYANDGRINVYDISNPAAPRGLGMQNPTAIGNNPFGGMIAYGTDYLIGFSWWAGNRDLVVIDRRNPNALVKVGELQIPNFAPYKGKFIGSKLYLVGDPYTEMIVVEMANPAAPAVIARMPIPTTARGIDIVGSDAFLAADTGGLLTTTTDTSNLAVTGSIATGGAAWDVVVEGGVAYVTNESGIAIVPVNAAPAIRTERISLALNGSSVVVTGASKAVTGGSPTVTIVDTATSAAVTNLPVNSDGSFNASLPAASGDPITITATSNGKTNGPVSLGLVPFGSAATRIPINSPAGDGNWRARTIKAEGNNLVVSSFPWDGAGDSPRLQIYDISNPSAPVLKRTVSTVSRVLDFELQNGTAYIAGDYFGTLDLNNPNSSVVTTSDPNGRDFSVALSGGYAFTSEVDYANDGRINIYDVATPSAPRWIRMTSPFARHYFTDLFAYGTNYLIGISYHGDNVDVVMIDHTNVNNLFKVSELSVPNVTAFRGRLAGSKIYFGGISGGAAIVDVSNPAAMTVVATTASMTNSRGADVTGGTMAVANASSISFFDVSGNVLTPIGTQQVGGTVWDVAYGRGQLYVADDTGIVVLSNVTAPPVIDTRLVSVSASSSSMATVRGTAGAVSGPSPFAAEVKDANSGATISAAIAADGSFNVSIPANAGDTFTVKVTDANNRVAGPVPVGTMPYGSSVVAIPIVNPGGDTNWRARTIKVEGNNLVLSSFPWDGFGDSPRLLIYDISNPSAPVLKRTVSTVSRVLDFELKNGIAYIAGDYFGTLDLNNPNSSIVTTSDPNGRDFSVAVAGGYAFTSEVDYANDGRINIYDVANPSAPRWLQMTSPFARHYFTDLFAYGTDYLIGVSYHGDGVDVVMVDRRNVNGLFKVSELSVPNVVGFRGKLVGSKLYFGGIDSGAAIVDVSNPAAMTVVASSASPVLSRGADVAGSVMAVAAGGAGVQFYDVSGGTLNNIGVQPTGGMVWDVAFGAANLYVAADQGLVVIQNVVAPPVIDVRQITVNTDGTSALVHGNASAITGLGSLTATVTDAASNASLTVSVNANGSFDATLPATAGDTITVKATDGNSRTAGPLVVGTVPFGTALNIIPIVNPAGDTNWRARTLKIDGNNLVLSSWPGNAVGGDANFGDSNKLVIYDISNPNAPVLKRVVSTVSRILDFDVQNGWAYIAGDYFGTLDLTSPNATVNTTGDPNGRDFSVALSGGYAFTSEVDYANDGRINIYDVADPGTPRFIKMTGAFARHYFTDLLAYGTNYLVGVSYSGDNVDVVVIDKRDVLNMTKLSELSVANVVGLRGRIVGSKLYFGGVSGGAAVVDLTNPAVPALLSSFSGSTMARGVDVTGSLLALATGGEGVSFYDPSTTTMSFLGQQPTGGIAWDLGFAAGNLYVANDQGLVVVQNIATPPAVRTELISMTVPSGTSTVSGSAHAIGGVGTTTVTINNTTSGASVSNVAVSATGTFSAPITASAGDKISITASDGAARTTTRALGQVPFFAVTNEFRATRDADGLVARRVQSDGTNTVLLGGRSFTAYPGPSGFAWKYSTGAPALTSFQGGTGAIQEVARRDNFVFVASDRLVTFDMTQATPALNVASGDPCGRDIGVTVSGNFAYTGEADCSNDGRLNIWNITNPAAPSFISQTGGLAGTGSFTFHVLLTLGTQYIAGVSPDTAVRDLTVISISNPSAPSKVATLDVPNFSSDAAIVDGNTVYLAGTAGGYTLGTAGGIAIIDVTNPAAPVLKSTIATPGYARGLAMVGTNELAVADGATGVTFIDVADKAHPVIEGTQQVNGQVHDIKAVGKTLYLASETRFQVVQRP